MHTDDARDRGFERALRQSLSAPAAVPAGDCVDAETLAAWSEGTLGPVQAASVELHVSACSQCQALFAVMARATPAPQAAVPLWRRWHVQWLVPMATAAATVAIWFAVPGRELAPSDAVREDRPIADLGTRPSAPAVAEPREMMTPVPPTLELPRSRADAPFPQAQMSPGPVQPPRAAVDALTKEREAKTKAATGGRSAADKAPQPTAALKPAREPKAVEEDTRLAATPPAPATPAPAPPAAPPPPSAAAGPAAATSGVAGSAPATVAPSRQERFGAAEQLRVARAAFIDVTSPSSTTRWRIAIGGRVEFFGTDAPAGRPTDVPATTSIVAGSSPGESVCWLVGRAGAVYLTTDGTRFTRIPFPEPVDLVSVRAADVRTATVTSSTARSYRTTDGGKTWQ